MVELHSSQDDIEIASQAVCSSQILLLVEVVDQSEIGRQLVDLHSPLGHGLVVFHSLSDDKLSQFYCNGGQVGPEHLLHLVVCLLKLEDSVEEARHPIEQLPLLLVQVGL